jgi:hypothetical protein
VKLLIRNHKEAVFMKSRNGHQQNRWTLTIRVEFMKNGGHICDTIGSQLADCTEAMAGTAARRKANERTVI